MTTEKPLSRVTATDLYHYAEGERIDGPHEHLTGDCTDLRGDCTYLRGDCLLMTRRLFIKRKVKRECGGLIPSQTTERA